MRIISRTVGVLAICLAGVQSATADSIAFSDDFNAEPVQLSVSTMNQWTVEGGTIDVITSGFQGLNCPDAGQCIDLDGSTSSAGKMVSNPIKLPAGDYVLTYQLSGNQRGGDDTVTVKFGDKKLRTLTLASDAPFKTYSDKIRLAAETTASISIQNAGGDFVGLILDNVALTTAGSVVTGYARSDKDYKVTCKNTTTGQEVTQTFLSLQNWDCAAMGLTVGAGEKFKATVEGRAK